MDLLDTINGKLDRILAILGGPTAVPGPTPTPAPAPTPTPTPTPAPAPAPAGVNPFIAFKAEGLTYQQWIFLHNGGQAMTPEQRKLADEAHFFDAAPAPSVDPQAPQVAGGAVPQGFDLMNPMRAVRNPLKGGMSYDFGFVVPEGFTSEFLLKHGDTTGSGATMVITSVLNAAGDVVHGPENAGLQDSFAIQLPPGVYRYRLIPNLDGWVACELVGF